ncbi:MAG TPA: hypothetical protein GXX30_03985 [Firmicutes bacterium]|nr:hypothetical protein [Candidatus Fermentithermobacillaceae bacterium]
MLIYAPMKGIGSSKKVEKASHKDVEFRRRSPSRVLTHGTAPVCSVKKE